VPAYRQILEEHGVDPTAVDSIAAFQASVPFLDKHMTFGRFQASELCLAGDLEGVRSLLTSSGHSGVFSFGVNTAENLARSSKSIDAGLQYIFNVDERSTLLVNALPMGVKVHTRATVLAETSVRDDMVHAVVKKFGDDFDQIILVGEGSFIKKIVEDGRDRHGIDWPSLHVHVITGEEGIAENYRSYMSELIGAGDDPAAGGRLVMSSMGVAELDLNIFHETRDTVALRRLAHKDPSVRSKLFGNEARFCPMLFVYYPHRSFVERAPDTLPGGEGFYELALSMLSPEMKIPLLRYRSGDYGKLFSHAEVAAVARDNGLPAPELNLPFVAVAGRGKALQVEGGRIYPEAVKEAIYAEPAVAAALTGHFRLLPKQPSGRVVLQRREDVAAPADAVERLTHHLRAFCEATPEVEITEHRAYPYGMELDYERKFQYLAARD
jgi:phenylacetate-CoA ligase